MLQRLDSWKEMSCQLPHCPENVPRRQKKWPVISSFVMESAPFTIVSVGAVLRTAVQDST